MKTSSGLPHTSKKFAILSGDSDLAPVTTKLKELCPGKKIGIVVPQNQSAMNLKLTTTGGQHNTPIFSKRYRTGT